MALHPVIASALSAVTDALPYSAMPIAKARALAKLPYANDRAAIPVSAVRNLFIPRRNGVGVPLRVYTPPGEGPHPLLVFFHGSGFVMLDIDSHDELCRRLCVGASCVVASVDYRLAPEHKFPAAPDDCLEATRWMAANSAEFGADSDRMAVCGDSAGGCLAAVTALRIRDEGGPELAGQLLFYPVTDYPSGRHASYRTYSTGFGLTADGMTWFWSQYLGDPSAAAHPHAAPLRALSVADMPNAYVLVAECDVLRSEGEAFAQRLREAGVPVLAKCASGMNHGFLKYASLLPEVAAHIDDACAWLRKLLQVPAIQLVRYT